MSFGKEMESFIAAFNAGMKVNAVREDIMSSRQKRGLIDDPMGPGNYQPGTGGKVGETEAPKEGDGGKTGGSKTADIAWKGASPQQRALLMAISGPESAGDYSVIYGGDKHITDFSKHPGVAVPIQSGPNQGKTSSAAGRYQFLGSTWNNIASAYHLPDFSPESQDMGAWYLASETYGRTTGRDLNTDLKSNDPAVIAGIGKALKSQWTSLPGGIEQGQTEDAFVSTYKKFLGAAPEGGTEAAPAGGIPDEGAAAPAPPATIAADQDTSEQDQQDIPPAEIDVPPVETTQYEEPPQVENGFQAMVGYQQGGAIPDDTGSGNGFLQFADGGNINPARDYTQNIAAPPVTMTPRINTNVLTPAKPAVKPVVKPVVKPAVKPAIDPNVMGPGGTTPLAVVPGRSGYSAVSPVGNAVYQQNAGSDGTGDRQGSGRNNSLNRLINGALAKLNGPGGFNSLTPQEKVNLQRNGLLRGFATQGQNVRGFTAAPPIPKLYARGGKVANRDDRFQQLLREETRRATTQHGGGDNARDRAARRLSAEEGRPSSTAYRPSRTSNKFPAAPKTGGGKPVPIPTPRPKTGGVDPWETREPPDRSVTGKTWPPGWEKAGEHGRTGPKGWDTDQGTSSPPGWDKNPKAPAPPGWKESAQGGKQQPGNQPLIDVPPTPPPEEEENPDRGPIRNYFGFAKGGAIPDDDGSGDPLWKRVVRGGKPKPNLREFKRKAGTLKDDTPETKSAQRKKPKNTAKPQKRDQKKRTGGAPRPDRPVPIPTPRPSPDGGLPSTGPIPTARPPTGGLPPTGPQLGARPLGPQQGPPFPQRPPAPPAPGPGTPGLTAPINTGVVAPPPFRPAITQGAQPPPPPNARPAGNPFDVALAGLKPAPQQAQGGVMSPIPGVAAPVNPGMDVPRGGTWAPPGAGPPGRMQPNVPAGPATPGQTAPGPGIAGAGDTSINPDDTIETLMQKLQALKSNSASGVSQYAKGGAIPDDRGGPDPNSEAEGAGYDASSADQGPVAGQRGYNESVAEGRTANFNEVAQRAAPSVRTGIQGLSRIFGIDPTGQQGVPDEATAARQEDGIRRFASGEGAATDQEVQAIDATHGNDRIQADEGTKQLMRIDQVVNFWLQRGDKDKAEAAAASLLQRGAMEVRNAGTMAAAAFDDYQKTGDVNALRHASQAVEMAYSFIPDGANIKIDIDPKTRQIVATTVGADGKSTKQVVDPQAIPGLLKQAMDGSAYWTSTFQIGQPRLAEQQMQDTAALERTKSNQAYDEYKFQRGEEAKIGAENRQAERWLWQQEYQTDQGRSPGERSTKAQQQFFESWGEDYQNAATPEEKKALLEEGLGYRFDSTRDRSEAVPEDELAIVSSSPNASTFTDPADMAAVRDIARVIAQKEPTMDGGTAMEVTAALVTAPELDFNPDGTMNVNGNSIVFNPQLLPQLGVLRNKYRQQPQ